MLICTHDTVHQFSLCTKCGFWGKDNYLIVIIFNNNFCILLGRGIKESSDEVRNFLLC